MKKSVQIRSIISKLPSEPVILNFIFKIVSNFVPPAVCVVSLIAATSAFLNKVFDCRLLAREGISADQLTRDLKQFELKVEFRQCNNSEHLHAFNNVDF